MPQVSTSGFTNIVAHLVDADLSFSRGDSICVVQALTAPRTVTLPGPTSTPDGSNTPGEGDYYTVQDPLGLITAEHTLSIAGGGYQLVNNGSFVDTYVLTTLEGFGSVTFTLFALPGRAPFWAITA